MEKKGFEIFWETVFFPEKDCIFVGHLYSFSAVRISLGL